jgi:hypothetical protein
MIILPATIDDVIVIEASIPVSFCGHITVTGFYLVPIEENIKTENHKAFLTERPVF